MIQVGSSPYAWTLLTPEMGLVVLASTAYLLSLRFERVSKSRIATFALAQLLVLAVLVTPLRHLSVEYLPSAHMLLNIVLAEWAPALTVAALPRATASRLGRFRLLPLFTNPLVALPLWLTAYYAWHLPPLYDAALRQPTMLLALEHASFYCTGSCSGSPSSRIGPGSCRAAAAPSTCSRPSSRSCRSASCSRSSPERPTTSTGRSPASTASPRSPTSRSPAPRWRWSNSSSFSYSSVTSFSASSRS